VSRKNAADDKLGIRDNRKVDDETRCTSQRIATSWDETRLPEVRLKSHNSPKARFLSGSQAFVLLIGRCVRSGGLDTFWVFNVNSVVSQSLNGLVPSGQHLVTNQNTVTL
jgi:hypothetical protein